MLCAGLIAVLPGCKEEPPEYFGSSVTPMDHLMTDTFVKEVYIDGHWVGSAGTGGSTVAGGFTLPTRWHPGLTAHVKWQRCNRRVVDGPQSEGELCNWHEVNAPVTRYGLSGGTWLHIIDDEHVMVIPSMVGPGHPDYPGPGFPEKNFFNVRQQEAYKKASKPGATP